MWAWVGRTAYALLGGVALPIFLGGSRRTRVIIEHKDTGHVVLGKTWLSSQQWKLIGGGLKKEEDPKKGAVREIYEETGIEVELDDLRQIDTITETERGASYEAIYFYCKVSSIDLRRQKLEMLEIAWIDPKKLPSNVDKMTTEVLSKELK